MAHGALSVFTGTLASAATSTGVIDLGRAWAHTVLEVPARSNTTLYVNAASSSDGTFRRTYNPASRAGAETTFQVLSATTNAFVHITANGMRFIKIESQDAISNGATFKVLCSDMGSSNG